MLGDLIGAVGMFAAVQLAVVPASSSHYVDAQFTARTELASTLESTAGRAAAAPSRAEFGLQAQAGPAIAPPRIRGDFEACCEGPPGFLMGPPWPPPPPDMPFGCDEEGATDRSFAVDAAIRNAIAMRLAGLEVEIGIRSEQLDAWRNFTDAVLELAKRPDNSADDSADAEIANASGLPFAFVDKLAQAMRIKAEQAGILQRAVDELRTRLSSDQLARAAAAEPFDGPPPFGPPPFAGRMPPFPPPPIPCESTFGPPG